MNNNCVIYARTAAKNDIIENQVEACKRFAEENGYSVIEIYIDNGFSGIRTKRPSLKKMLEDSQNEKFSKVIIFDVARLSRDRVQFNHIKLELQKSNTEIISVRNGNLNSVENEILLSIMEVVAECTKH